MIYNGIKFNNIKELLSLMTLASEQGIKTLKDFNIFVVNNYSKK